MMSISPEHEKEISKEEILNYLNDLKDIFKREYTIEEFAVEGTDINFNILSENSELVVSKPEDSTSLLYIRSPKTRVYQEVLKKDIQLYFDVIERIFNSRMDNLNLKRDITIYPQITIPTDPEIELTTPHIKSVSNPKETTPNKIEIHQPKIGFKDIGGHYEVKKKLKRIIYSIKNPEISKELGYSPPSGILLYGPPGTGKTLFAKATANESDAYFINVIPGEIKSKWHGETEQNLKKIFDDAKENTPSIVFFDEIDSFVHNRDSPSSSQANISLVGEILKYMDGMESVEGVIVMGATNREYSMDSALVRSGRFETIEVPLPDQPAREQIYQILLEEKKTLPNIDYNRLSNKSNGMSGADINKSINLAIERQMDEKMLGEILEPISTEELLKIINQRQVAQDNPTYA